MNITFEGNHGNTENKYDCKYKKNKRNKLPQNRIGGKIWE